MESKEPIRISQKIEVLAPIGAINPPLWFWLFTDEDLFRDWQQRRELALRHQGLAPRQKPC